MTNQLSTINHQPFPFLPTLKSQDRFWLKVEFTAGCWIWHGPRNSDGYGMLVTQKNNKVTHLRVARIVYEKTIGPIPEGLMPDHLCRITSCVNPFHLEPVTNQENILRGESPAGKNGRKVLCIKGHQLFGPNLLIRKYNGNRMCRSCYNLRRRTKYNTNPEVKRKQNERSNRGYKRRKKEHLDLASSI